MKKVIEFYSMGYGAGLFSTPNSLDKREVVEVKSEKELDKYVESHKDSYGHSYRKKNSFGFSYISNQGGVKVKDYIAPKIKKIV